MMRFVISITVVLALAACGSVAKVGELEPGHWQISTKITDIDVPGATSEQIAAFREAVGTQSMQEQCLSEAEATLSPKSLAAAFPHDDNCQASEFEIANGSLSGEMICSLPDGSELKTPLTGTVSRENFQIAVPAEMSGDEFPEGRASVLVEISGQYAGDC